MSQPSLVPEPVELICYRATFPDRDALDLPASAKSAGRYHEESTPVPAYASLDEDTPLAELQKQAGASLAGAKVRLTQMTFDSLACEVVTPGGQLAAGTTEADLVSDDYAACHALAARVRKIAAGLIAPSAAVSGSASLIVWHESVASTLTVVEWRIVTFPDRLSKSASA